MRRVVIIGAGVLGSALAAELACTELVTLVDAGPPGCGASATSMAWLNAQHKLPEHYHRLNVAGMKAHRRWSERLAPRPGWYRPTGGLRWAEDEASVHDLADLVSRLSRWGYPCRLIGPQEAEALEPALRLSPVARAAWFPEEALADPGPLLEALVQAACDAGATVVAGTAVTAVESRGGRVTGARLADGRTLKADVLVCCAGRDAARVAASAGITVPLVPGDAPGSAAPALFTHLAHPGVRGPSRALLSAGFNARPWNVGHTYVEADDVNDVVDASTTPAERKRLARVLLDRKREALPRMWRSAAIVRTGICVRPLPADGHPVAGPSEELDGWYTLVTHSGMTLGLRLAELVAREITTGSPQTELAPYRPGRFGAGSG